MKSASEYWKDRFGEEPKSDNDKLMCAMMREYAEHYQGEMQQALSLGAVSVSLPTELGEYVDKYNSLVKEINELFNKTKFSVGELRDLTNKRDDLKRKIVALL